MAQPDPTQALRRARARSFDAGAQTYQQARPEYPPEAVHWLLPEVPGGRPRVLDLAAGTGKLTAGLLAAGADVVAVEPADAMRAQLQERFPEVRALPGSAEDTGMPDDAFDAVVVGQAWHWFDAPSACREIARVLRPGGRLGVVWNVRDHTVDWVQEFTDIIHRGDSLDPSHGPPALDDQFVGLEHRTFSWSQPMTPAALRLLAASRSHLLTLDPTEREVLLADVDRLAVEHPALAGRPSFDMPYRAEAWRAHLGTADSGTGR